MSFKSVKLKVGSMRKEQNFAIYPNGTSDKYILLQSDKRMAVLIKDTGRFFITSKNYNYPNSAHLNVDRIEIDLSNEIKEEIRRNYSSSSNGKNGMIMLI
jgi:hypothetical protein